MRISSWSAAVCSSDLARDTAIAARLVDPAVLAARAEAGARHGAADGLAGAGETLRRRIDADTAAHAALNDRLAADAADRRAHELRRRRWDRWWNGALAGFALLVPVALGYGRSEEHPSELQSLMRISYAVFCLKKKNNIKHKLRLSTNRKRPID